MQLLIDYQCVVLLRTVSENLPSPRGWLVAEEGESFGLEMFLNCRIASFDVGFRSPAHSAGFIDKTSDIHMRVGVIGSSSFDSKVDVILFPTRPDYCNRDGTFPVVHLF